MGEDIGGEIGTRIGEFEVVAAWDFTVDINIIGKTCIIGAEKVHVGPQKVVPVADTAFENKADVVDKTVIVAVQVDAVINKIQGIDISESPCQHLEFPKDLVGISVRISVILRLEIGTRVGILIGDDGRVLDVVGIDGMIVDFPVGHCLEIVVDRDVVRRSVVEHLVDGPDVLGEFLVVGKADEDHQIGERHLLVPVQMDVGCQMVVLRRSRRHQQRNRV